jgi:Kinetochore Sim4 complex subunit FTA2
MYPDWPESASDLVPLPQCDGPKLKPFDFKGPQKIGFLDHVGEGLHAHVFKVEILAQIYALKLVSNLPNTRKNA